MRLYLPLAIPALRLQQKVFGSGKVTSYVRAKMLTHDPVEAALYDGDPLIFRAIAINLLLDLNDTARRLLADAGAIQVPTLMLAAGRDWVVSLKAQREFFNGLSSPRKQMHVFPAMLSRDFSRDGPRAGDRTHPRIYRGALRGVARRGLATRCGQMVTPGRNTSA